MEQQTDRGSARVDEVETGPAARGAPGKATLTGRIHRRARDGRGVADGADEAVAGLGGGGAPLPADARARFERSLGSDLGAVRLHTDDASAAAADAVGARAFARGSDVHFGAGQYQPDDPFGMHLLAHEVAHTVQQGGAPTTRYKLAVSSPGDAAEVEADRAADAMVRGEPFAVTGAASMIARDASDAGKPGAAKADAKPKPDEKVGTQWYLNFEDKATGGAAVKAKVPARETKDALYATLKIFPEEATSAEKIEGVDAANHGQVFVKSLDHPKDKGGRLSAEVKYGTKPTAKISVGLGEAGSSKDDAALKAKLQKQIDDKTASMMSDATFDQGDPATIKAKVKAAAQTIIDSNAGDKAGHFTLTVDYTEHPGTGSGYSLKEAAYGPIKDKAQCYAKVIVPSEKLTGQAGGSLDTHDEKAKETKDAESLKQAEEQAKSDEKVKKTVESVRSQIGTALKSAWSDAKKKHTAGKTTISGSAKETATSELGGKLQVGVNAKDLELPLPGKLGQIAKLLVKLKGDVNIGGEIAGKVTGGVEFNQGVAHEHLDELTTEKLSTLDSQVTTSIESYTSKEATTSLSTVVKNSYEVQRSHEEKNALASGKKTSSTWSTTTINFKVGDPILTLTITQ